MKKIMIMAAAAMMLIGTSCGGGSATGSNDSTGGNTAEGEPKVIEEFDIAQGSLDRSGVGMEAIGIAKDGPIKIEVMGDDGGSQLLRVSVPCIADSIARHPKEVNNIKLYLSYKDSTDVKECAPLLLEDISKETLKKLAESNQRDLEDNLVFKGRMPKDEVAKLKAAGKTVRTGLHDFNFIYGE